MAVFFIVEASHLFRAGDKYKTQFFVLDVVHCLQRWYFPKETAKTIVLHGSVKDAQAAKYANALERHGVQVIRMKPIPSAIGNEKWYFRPTYYIHQMMGKTIPKGSKIVLVGFHNPRYLKFLKQYYKDFDLSIAAFATSSKQGLMSIPAEFRSLVKDAIELDEHVVAIKSEFKKNAPRRLPED